MSDGPKGGKYEVNGVMVDSEGRPLKGSEETVVLDRANDVAHEGTDVVPQSDEPKAKTSRK